MRRMLPLGLLAALVLAGSATAGGAPPPTGAPLMAPTKLPTPKKAGGAAFALVTVHGVPKPGVVPHLDPIGYGPPPATLRVVVLYAKPTIAGGKFTQRFLFAVGDVSTTRLLERTRGGDAAPQIDFLGTPSDWAKSPTTDLPQLIPDCKSLRTAYLRLDLSKMIYGLPGDKAFEMWLRAVHKANCPPPKH